MEEIEATTTKPAVALDEEPKLEEDEQQKVEDSLATTAMPVEAATEKVAVPTEKEIDATKEPEAPAMSAKKPEYDDSIHFPEDDGFDEVQMEQKPVAPTDSTEEEQPIEHDDSICFTDNEEEEEPILTPTVAEHEEHDEHKPVDDHVPGHVEEHEPATTQSAAEKEATISNAVEGAKTAKAPAQMDGGQDEKIEEEVEKPMEPTRDEVMTTSAPVAHDGEKKPMDDEVMPLESDDQIKEHDEATQAAPAEKEAEVETKVSSEEEQAHTPVSQDAGAEGDGTSEDAIVHEVQAPTSDEADEEEAKPVEHKPVSAEEQKLVEDEKKLVAAVDDEKPAEENITADDKKSVEEEMKNFAADDEKSVEEEKKPVAANDEKPAEEDRKPVAADDEKPVEKEKTLVAAMMGNQLKKI